MVQSADEIFTKLPKREKEFELLFIFFSAFFLLQKIKIDTINPICFHNVLEMIRLHPLLVLSFFLYALGEPLDLAYLFTRCEVLNVLDG